MIIIRATGRGEGSLNVGGLAAGWGWGSRRESWLRTRPAGWDAGPQTLGSLSRSSLSDRSGLHAPPPSPSNLPKLCSLLSPPPPPSLPGPWIMSTRKLENRTRVCFASLAPSRQHQLPASEEGAALGWPASLPTLARLIKDGHFFPVWHHRPLITWCPACTSP